MIQAKDLSKRFADGALALDALSLEVDAGEIYFLLGANGSGKTSVIDLFLGLLRPTAGKATIAGFDCHQEAAEVRRRCAYLPADFTFYESLSARQNLKLFAQLDGQRRTTHESLNMALRETGLPERVFDRRLSSFAPGMRQKLAVAVALVRDVPVWLLDEPLSGLDPQAAAEVMELISRARDAGKAILWATEDLFRAKQLANRVGILKEGRQVLSFSREELAYQDLEKLYLDYMRGGPSSPPGTSGLVAGPGDSPRSSGNTDLEG